ncbi:MAG: hypothetical protein Q8L53_14340 [Aestuariivirga sp.]|nr:hypothetical protein [Aestuariivirga sp.]
MSAYSENLRHEVKLPDESCKKLATTIAADVRFLPREIKDEIGNASPVPIRSRLEELQAFQGWMELAGGLKNPFVTRAQVITQNYICFVYLPEACFAILRKHAPPQSAAKKCSTYLTDNPIRAFRNAIAHSNWHYRQDFSGLVYWARRGERLDEQLIRFEVDSQTLSFWQSLSRCAAYAIYENLD